MNLTVNGTPVVVPPGSTLLQVRRAAGESMTYA